MRSASQKRSRVSKLGIIAGDGLLPGQIIDVCRQTGRSFHVLAFEGSARADVIGDAPVEWIKMSGLSRALDAARKAGVEELVLVGKIPRPSIMELMRDARSAKFMAKIGTRMLGDNNILSAVVKELEESEGFTVIAPETLLTEILSTEGAYGAVKPDDNDLADIRRGLDVAREIGRLDIGQAVVVHNGTIVGVEGLEGTDQLIARCGGYLGEGSGHGILVKTAKPGQERRTDLPAIGRSTVQNAVRAGLKGIAVEAGGALVVEREEMIATADQAGIFVVGVTIDG